MVITSAFFTGAPVVALTMRNPVTPKNKPSAPTTASDSSGQGRINKGVLGLDGLLSSDIDQISRFQSLIDTLIAPPTRFSLNLETLKPALRQRFDNALGGNRPFAQYLPGTVSFELPDRH